MVTKKRIYEYHIPHIVIAYPPYPFWEWLPVKTGVTADPAAGADPVAVTVPAGKRWLILIVSSQLVNDATGITRYPYLEVMSDGINVDARYMQSVGLTASQTGNFTVVSGATNMSIAVGATVYQIAGIPGVGIELMAGASFRIRAFNLQAGDNWGVERYLYKERDL